MKWVKIRLNIQMIQSISAFTLTKNDLSRLNPN